MDIQVYVIEKIVRYWWFKKGSVMLTKQLQSVRRSCGTVIRMDHTYKAVKQLGAYDQVKECWVAIKASLLLALSEKGFVMAYNIVPNDTRHFMIELLTSIWLEPDRYF